MGRTAAVDNPLLSRGSMRALTDRSDLALKLHSYYTINKRTGKKLLSSQQGRVDERLPATLEDAPTPACDGVDTAISRTFKN